MINLIIANIKRLRQSRVFLICTIVMILLGIFISKSYYDMMQEIEIYAAARLYYSGLFILIISPTFCSLFIGTEYSDGIIRNKIIAGHNRIKIYISNLIVSAIATLIMFISYVVPYCLLTMCLTGTLDFNIDFIGKMSMYFITLILSITSINIMISMIKQSKSSSVALCLIIGFVMLFVSVYINSKLEETKYLYNFEYAEYASELDNENMLNPNYIDGNRRVVYQTIIDVLPAGQALQITNNEKDLNELMCYSISVFIITTSAGIIVFRRKNIR